MIAKQEVQHILNDLFEEEALTLGGLFAIHRTDDDLIWRLMKSLETLRCKALRRVADSDLPNSKPDRIRMPDLTPHPAIQSFLAHIQNSYRQEA